MTSALMKDFVCVVSILTNAHALRNDADASVQRNVKDGHNDPWDHQKAVKDYAQNGLEC